jgi:hypothetical protein
MGIFCFLNYTHSPNQQFNYSLSNVLILCSSKLTIQGTQFQWDFKENSDFTKHTSPIKTKVDRKRFITPVQRTIYSFAILHLMAISAYGAIIIHPKNKLKTVTVLTCLPL